MPKFKLGPEAWYHQGEYHQPFTVVDLPPDVQPSRTWEPLDEEAEELQQELRQHDLEREALKLKAEEARIDLGSLESLVAKMADAKVERVLAQKKAASGHSDKKPPKPPPAKKPEQEPKKPEGAETGRASDQSVV